MIIHFGEMDNGYISMEVCKKYELGIKVIPNLNQIEKIEEEILNKKPKYAIIDISSLTDEVINIIESVKKIRFGCSTKLIFFAIGYNEKSKIITELKDIGFNKIILNDNIIEIKNKLEICLDLIENETVYEEVQKIEKYIEDSKRKTISIIGSMSRIGTTTLSINLCKYLLYNKYKVCYIELNNNKYIDKINKYYIGEERKDKFISYENIDFYDDIDSINKVLKENTYDYYIYDYGNMKDMDKSLELSFLEKDINILVCGTKSNEMESTEYSLSKLYDKDVIYVFNFIDNKERNDILELMEEEKDKTYFLENTVNMFDYNKENESMYKGIIKNIEDKEEVNKTRFSIFKKGRK